jgi:hypothetical protein
LPAEGYEFLKRPSWMYVYYFGFLGLTLVPLWHSFILYHFYVFYIPHFLVLQDAVGTSFILQGSPLPFDRKLCLEFKVWLGTSSSRLSSYLLGRLRLEGFKFEVSSGKYFVRTPHLQNNQSKVDWRCGSKGRVPVL